MKALAARPAEGVEWNPITGCSPASTGCANCIPMKLAIARADPALTVMRNSGPVWTGEVRLNAAAMAEPLQLAAPAIVAVCSHGDLFHDRVPAAWVDQVFNVMARAAWHTFLLPTKRAARMRSYLAALRLRGGAPSNVVFGAAVERQKELDARAPDLIAIPARRYLSLYPLLGPMDLRSYLKPGAVQFVAAGQEVERPADPAWFASIERQCAAAGVTYVRSDRLMGG